MRIVNFKKKGVATLGVRRGNEVIDLSIADKSLPGDLAGLLAAGKGALAKAAVQQLHVVSPPANTAPLELEKSWAWSRPARNFDSMYGSQIDR